MKVTSGLATFALLAACQPAPGPASEPAPAATATATIAPAVDLAGGWRLAGIDGEEFDRPYAISLSADATRIWWEPACAGQRREYTVSGNNFATIPPPDEPQIVCEIGYPDELPRLWQILDRADTIERTPENGVLISGEGGSVLLFSQ